MTPSHLSIRRIILLCTVLTLIMSIYQHNKLVYLTYTNQHLSKQKALLMQKCMLLQSDIEAVASNNIIMDEAENLHGMIPLSYEMLVPLSSVLPGQ